MPECFFAHLGGCEGRLVKAHLIPKQRIKAAYSSAASRARAVSLVPLEAPMQALIDRRSEDVIWDPRVWVPMCGGLTGIGGHHGAFDAKQIRLRRDELPEGLEEFAREYGLEWSLDRDYGLWTDPHCGYRPENCPYGDACADCGRVRS